MKRKLAILTAAALMATPLAANAAPPKKPAAPKKTTRTLTFNYTGALAVDVATGLGATVFGATCALPRCWDFETVKGEKSVTITAKDATGTPISLHTRLDADNSTMVYNCGTAPLKISPKSAHTISVYPAFSAQCQALPTQG
ncbi:MAG TPA: hypothetical protein VNA30_07610, partial [Mycobacteriales bacterium]|nr:hypothetical protein [Mycobacteriales bacterium]